MFEDHNRRNQRIRTPDRSRANLSLMQNQGYYDVYNMQNVYPLHISNNYKRLIYYCYCGQNFYDLESFTPSMIILLRFMMKCTQGRSLILHRSTHFLSFLEHHTGNVSPTTTFREPKRSDDLWITFKDIFIFCLNRLKLSVV